MKRHHDHFAEIDQLLVKWGHERTRANYLALLYDELPETWDQEAEDTWIPPDLRLDPAPDVPIPDLN